MTSWITSNPNGPRAGERGILIDTDALPVVVATFPGEPISDAALQAFLETVDSLVARSPKIAFAVDFRSLREPPNAGQRAMLTQWMRRSAARNRGAIVGTSLIVRSALLRGAITAVHWVQPPVSPQHVAANLADAVSWCRRMLRDAGCPS